MLQHLTLCVYLLGLVVGLMVVVSESPVATLAPGVEAPVVKDTCRVGGATADLHDTLSFHGFHEARCVYITVR